MLRISDVKITDWKQAAGFLASERRRQKIGQKQIARAIQGRQARVSAYEHGQSQPRLDTLLVMLDTLGYDLVIMPKGQPAKDGQQ